tara:strand:- start:95439 stop:96485 length:1047 start_codon:yes stop_codon:yes gene_type:complete
MVVFQKNPFLIKLNNLEFWPLWFYYIPVWVQHFWLAVKVKNLFFFLSTNPAIDGFILSDSKYRTLNLVPEKYRPKTILIKKNTSASDIIKMMDLNEIAFPIILKPDIGYRGLGVHKIENSKTLKEFLGSTKTTYILQEFIKSPLEIGIFYYRYPNEKKGHIPSITVKEFLTVTGNGKDTLESLVLNNHRGVLLKDKLRNRFKDKWHYILKNDESLVLEWIGNHNRGTKFINANHLIDDDLVHVFDELSHQMDGFYFGRFDIKVASLDALKSKKYKILEVNGVGGEPTHIYDSSTSLFEMWGDLCFVWRIAANIALINFNLGINKPTYKEAYGRWRAYRAYKTELKIQA